MSYACFDRKSPLAFKLASPFILSSWIRPLFLSTLKKSRAEKTNVCSSLSLQHLNDLQASFSYKQYCVTAGNEAFSNNNQNSVANAQRFQVQFSSPNSSKNLPYFLNVYTHIFRSRVFCPFQLAYSFLNNSLWF